jgi:hypothetical protein
MPHLSIMVIGTVLFVVVLIVATAVCLREAAQKEAPLTARVRKPEKPPKYARRICGDCGRMVSIRKDGSVHRRHRCHMPQEAA